MKFGVRKPSIKKSIKARTTGKAKRALKKSVNPLYGKKGMGFINDPKKAVYNKVYNKTTVGVNDIIKNSGETKQNENNNIKTDKYNPSRNNTYSKPLSIFLIVCGTIIVMMGLLLSLIDASGFFFTLLGVLFILWGRKNLKKFKELSLSEQNPINKSSISDESIDNVYADQGRTIDESITNPDNLLPAEDTEIKFEDSTGSNTDNITDIHTKREIIPLYRSINRISYTRKYYYKDINVVGTDYIEDKTPHNEIQIGDDIIFQFERENKFDNKAILVLDNKSRKLGYIRRGRLQDMIHDFTSRDEPVIAAVYSLHPLEIEIGFYKYEDEEIREGFESYKIVKLTANSNEDMQFALSVCEDNEEVNFEYDFDKEKYLISASGGDIGYINKTISEYLYELDEEDYYGIIRSLEYDDYKDKYSASVEIFVK